MVANDEDDEAMAADLRRSWLNKRIVTALRVKSEKLEDVDEEAHFGFDDFLNSDSQVLFVSLGDRDRVIASAVPPTSYRKKSCYFIKQAPAKLSTNYTEFHQQLICGEFAKTPLEQLGPLIQQIFLPSIRQEWAGLTELLVSDVKHGVADLVSLLTRVLGLTNSRTVLPMPIEEISETDGGQSFARDALYSLESCVVVWSDQIKAVLDANPEQILIDSEDAGAMKLLEFWEAKAANLKYIKQQLESDKTLKLREVLMKARSSYMTSFNQMVEQVNDSHQEAQTIVPLLRIIEPTLISLEQGTEEYTATGSLFLPIMHWMYLIWQNSKYFNQLSHMLLFCRMVLNDVVTASQRFCDSSSIFQATHIFATIHCLKNISCLMVLLRDHNRTSLNIIFDTLLSSQHHTTHPAFMFQVEIPEATQRLRDAIKLCTRLKRHFERYQQKVEKTGRCWQLPSNLLFGRLNRFIDRTKSVMQLVVTIGQFQRLERIEIGSTKGEVLTKSTQQVFSEFCNKLKIFADLQYDCFDVDNPSFTSDFVLFMSWVSDAEAQLASIVAQGIADTDCVHSVFKLLHSFEGVINRPNITSALEKEYTTLLRRYISDLKSISGVFVQNRDNPPIYVNMPQLTGALHWTSALKTRATFPMAQFEIACAGTEVLQSDEMAQSRSILEHIITMIDEYEHNKQEVWANEVDTSIVFKLDLPLLHIVQRHCKDTAGAESTKECTQEMLAVNFAPALVRLLREVSYLIRLGLEVPPQAAEIYSKSALFQNHIGLLDMVVNKYNWIQTNLLSVERPLLQEELLAIDASLEQGLHVLNWKSGNIAEFVSEVASTTKQTDAVLQVLKDNVQKIEAILEAEAVPLLQRVEGRVYLADELQELVQDTCDIRRDEFGEKSLEIHELAEKSNKAVKTGKGSSIWRDYVGYLNTIICDGFSRAITVSLQHLRQQVDSAHLRDNDLLPLVQVSPLWSLLFLKGAVYQVSLDLEKGNGSGQEVMFTPNIGPSGGRVNLRDMVLKWICDYHTVFNGMKRVCTGMGSYQIEIDERTELREQVQAITNLLSVSEEECNTLLNRFEEFSHLWQYDIEQFFVKWWEENAVTPAPSAPPEVEEGAESEAQAVTQTEEAVPWPPIAAFDEQITKYTEIRSQVNQLANHEDVGWIRVDCKPIRLQCIYWAEQWLAQYTNFLLQHIIDSMSSLYKFMEKSNATLATTVSDNDEVGLKKVLECICDVKKRTTRYDGIVEPLRAQVALLRKFDVAVPEATLKQMEEASDGWDACKHKMFETKERLAELYNKEGAKVKDRAFQFTKQVTDFRVEFKGNAPFAANTGCEAAYIALEAQSGLIESNHAEMLQLQQLQELFELVPGEYREIQDCSKELKLLKAVWDVSAMVEFQFASWKELLWEGIDTEVLITECKQLKDIVRKLDKKVRVWDAYKGVDEMVVNMLTVLPLIQQLKMPSMRERHWKELMTVTGTHFTIDSSFCLADILSVQLHRFAETVEGVVIKSQKELVIEKNVSKISEVWDNMEMQYFPYPNDDTVHLMKVSEELVEAREEHQVALQAMQASKYIKVFEEQVNAWLKNLGLVEAVCQVWTSVQDKWMQLESIFIGSEDIRAQLPEDSKRFDTIDEDWRSLMGQSVSMPNALEVCSAENQLARLETMEEMLDLCQKALDEYLGTKRTAFPRFYFVAPADLLDILSKGSNPLLIQPHFSKCFDNIAKLEFDPEEVKTGKAFTGLGMYSAEKEYVTFHVPFDATGKAVENYLQDLVDHHHTTVKMIIQDSIQTYSADLRDKWLFQYCCQVVLVASMIWWASEVSQAFSALEDGMETALKDQLNAQVEQLKKLSALVRGKLEKGDRRKIVTLMTIDVHARDVVGKLISKRVETSSCFEWLSQLRLQWCDDADTVLCDSCDARFIYGYEYVGNCGRLVITPLTDRCVITLTQALRLKMGGAPAGPAGTGKTETTKDLARALGQICYVFNCSPQMTAKVMSNIFRGLAASGSWGCFDEFNRIAIETLSVIATMFRSVLQGMRTLCKVYPAHHEVIGHFNFEGEECALDPTAMAFITMNPGYAGRTELPENVKALFRSVAMIVPDIEMICEIMLFSEGFVEAKNLSRKFMLLFRLNKDLLSIQTHYDWGLRAVKSILVIAGGLKRADPDVPEDGVLMRALRDCNLPKLVLDDVDVFLGVVQDIFPGWDLPRRRNEDLEDTIKAVCKERKLLPEEIFIAKISALAELFEVRHSVFVLGPAGSGKSSVWRVLADSQALLGTKTVYEIMNPKSQDTNELYGFIHPVLGWKDGVFSYVMRNFAQMENEWSKWIVMDGEVDPDWIESLNTVMDDNKMLTLASNERVPLNPTMRLLIEVSNLRNASPATVSRGGVLMINERDLGWRPFVESWVQERASRPEQQMLETLFDEYFDVALDYIRRNIKSITNVMEINMVMSVCYLLDTLLEDDDRKEILKEITEVYFVYASVWGLGGSLSVDKGVDYRKQFSDWWKLTFQAVQFGDNSIYDYQVDTETHTLVPWDKSVQPYVHTEGRPIFEIMVPTVESVRLTTLMSQLAMHHHHVQLVGLAGTAKTTLTKELLRDLDEDWSSCTIFLNSHTTANEMQMMVEGYVEKRAGKTFAPPANKRHIYFLDDLNMPGYDKWGVQTPIELLVQLVGHGFLWDRNKIGMMKLLKSVQYISAMNPTSGAFHVSSRLQRQFTCFACNLPSTETIEQMYLPILKGHLAKFDTSVLNYAETIMGATVSLHEMMLKYFLPNAIKFHYQWNLRELTNIFQGMLTSSAPFYNTPAKLTRLWLHEVTRTYSDRLLSQEDIDQFAHHRLEVVHNHLGKCGIKVEELIEEPILFCDFCHGEDCQQYLGLHGFSKLKDMLQETLTEYNESHANMDLVLFENFMEHVVRIARVIFKPRGNAMIVGVGGSGKQSLTKLTAFIRGLNVFQLQLTSNYTVSNLKEDLMNLYKKTGIKNESTVWLLTDAQVIDEGFLVCLNDFLSSGVIPDLFSPEDKGDIISAIRNEVKAEGLIDTNDVCWSYFLDKVRSMLHAVFCVSPVGEKMRLWCRKFPALINCSVIDWVHTWPEEALKSVAIRFLTESNIDLGQSGEGLREKIALHMSMVHQQTVEMCGQYTAVERRYNYATPKSYLEYIDLYCHLLEKKQSELQSNYSSLELGLQKLQQTEEDVNQLKIRLQEQAVYVAEKTESVEKLLVTVGQETQVVNEAAAAAAIENEKAQKERETAGAIQSQCDSELQKAEPLVQAALAALDTLTKEAIIELKTFNNPPSGVSEVCECVLYMMSENGKLCKDASFKAAKKDMNNPGEFVSRLKSMNINNIPRANVTKVKQLIEKNKLAEGSANGPEVVVGRSLAAGGLANWVVNIVKYDDAYQMITPLRSNLAAAKNKLSTAEAALKVVVDQVNELQAKLQALTNEFEKATEEKNDLVADSEKTKLQLVMAERLVNGLANEKVRWAENIESIKTQSHQLLGDTVMAAAFVSYIGAFSATFRQKLTNEVWMPDLLSHEIPCTEGAVALDVLCTIADKATWANEGLPADQLSIENAAIITNCARWPLLIDPQLQGITWIKSREAESDLKVIQMGGKFLDSVERAVSMGQTLIIDNLTESVDPVIEPVLSRSTVKRGGMVFIKLGDKDDVEYDSNFHLYLQTKMANPHYPPETAAQTTLINFTVTEKGLEDQLLAVVVQNERPELETRLVQLVRESNEFTKMLKELEEGLLHKLSHAEGNLIEDIELIENLEQTKLTAIDIETKQKEGKLAEIEINNSREAYRPAAARSSLIYFVLNQLNIVDHMYQYSLSGFMRMFTKSITRAETSGIVETRVKNVTESVTITLFKYASRGLFARHKQIFAAQLCFRVMAQNGELSPTVFDFLLRCPRIRTEKPPELEWLSEESWHIANALCKLDGLENLCNDLVSSSKRFKEWCDLEASEKEKLPLEYKNLPRLEQLCMVRCLRPDRMTMATDDFVEEYMGSEYIKDVSVELEGVLPETDPLTPVYFILSAGVDVVGEVEKAGAERGMTPAAGKFSDVSLGEGKDIISDREVDRQCKEGGWVILQNVHLMPRWLLELEKRIEQNGPDAHPDFRLFITSDPSKTIPIPLLQRSIKLVQEPPPGLKALCKRSWLLFNDSTWENSSKQTEMKITLFALTFFHGVVVERKKFGPQGWNRMYPFNHGDLTVCKDVLFNYFESAGTALPWEDLKYIFGEIMYGGHITDDFDRLLCSTYLERLMCNELFEGLELYPGFASPPNIPHSKMLEYIDDMETESPIMFGLHPNAELGFRTDQSETLYRTVGELQPRSAGSGSDGGGGTSADDRVRLMIEEINDQLADENNVVDSEELMGRIEAEEGRTPYVNVFYQEVQYMNALVLEIKKSLELLQLGMNGELQMSDAMETLMNELFLGKVPSSWEKVSFVSIRFLAGWLEDLNLRLRQLQDWVVDLGMPRVVWVAGFFNPQSFLTAILQTMARKNEWPLDRVVVATEVTKKNVSEVEHPARDGAFIHGLAMEGARWDTNQAAISPSLPKEMFYHMPVMLAKAIPVDKSEFKDSFLCPVYKTKQRGHTFVFKANLRTKLPASTWIIAGVALLMDIGT